MDAWNFSTEDIDYPSLEVLEEGYQNVLVPLFSFTAFVSLTGNTIVIVVLSLGRRSCKELKFFLINLSVSDVTMAIFSIPFTYTQFLLGKWVFQPWFCPIAMTMQHLSVLLSVYTLAAIGIDRYRAVVNPLAARVTSSNKGVAIAVIWIISVPVASVQLFISKAVPFKYARQWHYSCIETWENDMYSQIYTLLVFTITFLVPLSVLTFTYIAIAFTMWRRALPGNADPSRDGEQLKAKWKIIRMMLLIVVLFAVCWLPLQTFVITYYFVPAFRYYHSAQERRRYALTYFACLWLANANSFVNPFVYSFMSENFRMDMKDILLRVSRRQGRNESLRRSITTKTTTFKEPVVECRHEVDEENVTIELNESVPLRFQQKSDDCSQLF